MPRVQYNMVDKLISHSKETYIAGDDDQAIFRWSGADVDKFISLKGNVTVLDKSYRCPQRIYRLANYIITRIRNRRPKTWSPKDNEGRVARISHLRHIDLSKGNWLILSRTRKIRNEMVEDFLLQEGSKDCVILYLLDHLLEMQVQREEGLQKIEVQSQQKLMEVVDCM